MFIPDRPLTSDSGSSTVNLLYIYCISTVNLLFTRLVRIQLVNSATVEKHPNLRPHATPSAAFPRCLLRRDEAFTHFAKSDSEIAGIKENPALHTTVRDSNLVPEVRLELTRFYPADFESAASTIPPPGETSRKEEAEVYQFLAKKAMD